MSVFICGVCCGFLLAFALAWIIGNNDSERPAPVSPRQNIHQIERQAIREMVATAMVSGQISKAATADGNNTQPGADSS